MSQRSQRSTRTHTSAGGGGDLDTDNRQGNEHQRYGEGRPVGDHELYLYALRVVLLQHAIANKPAPVPLPLPSKRDSSASNTTSRPVSQYGQASIGAGSSSASSSSSTWSSGFSALSLSDLFRSSSSTSSSGSPKYPERFVKVLEHRIEAISRGTDRVYTDLLLRYTIGAFYGKFKDPRNARMFKETRKLEDLLMLFIATATDVLRKRCTGDEWKWRLEGQLGHFVDICETALRHKDVRHVPPDLLTKLHALKSKISANRPSPPATAQSDGGNPTSSSAYDGSSRPSLDMSASTGMSPTASHAQSSTQASSSSTTAVSYNVADIPAARQLAVMFGVDVQHLQRDVNTLRGTCTEKHALADLKQCINLISANAAFPASSDDFATDEAYKQWRSAELSSLQQDMLAILKRSPELVQSSKDTEESSGSRTGHSAAGSNGAANHTVTEAGEAYIGKRISRASLPIADQFTTSLSLSNASSQDGSHDQTFSQSENGGLSSPATTVLDSRSASFIEDAAASSSFSSSFHSLTFIPPSPQATYCRLLDIMLSHDLEAMADLDPSEEVPLRILSKPNQTILSDCAKAWRITQSLQFAAFVEEMTRRYAAGEMPVVECVTEALGDFEALNSQSPPDSWPVSDRQRFERTISQLLDALLRGFYETYSEQLPQVASASVYDAVVQLSDLPLFEIAVPEHDLAERLSQLKEGIRRVSDFFYGQQREALFSSQEQQVHELQAQHGAQGPSIAAFLDLLNWIKTSAKRFDKQYRAPLFASVDVPQLFLERVVELYLSELSYKLDQLQTTHSARPLYTTPNDAPEDDRPPLTDGAVNALYVGVKELTDMHRAFCPGVQLSPSINQQFEPYILRWLAETDKKTLGWVRSAINLDDFKPDDHMEADKHSSSIIDLIASCKGALQFVTDLDWPDECQNAMFVTRLSATISKAVEQYCVAIEELFMREVMPPRRDSMGERDERTSAWITRAKALYQDKKLETYQFLPTSCLKLNNIHAARDLLDKMYTAVDADKVAALTRTKGPPVPPKASQASRNLFTIKIVLGEGLATADGVSRVDPFVTLSDERGMRIAKTRTLYETKEPRWAETFDVSVEGKMWIAATVWNRNLVDEHELLGRSYVALDPAVYGDYLPHDLWQELDTCGRLLLRVSMEGEKDDIQFYFGRAFRSLKRAENDMTRIIVDKIAPFIRSCISTASLRSLLKRGGYGYLNNLGLEKAFEKAKLENGLEGVKNLKNLIRARDPNAPMIPLPPSFNLDGPSEKPLPSLATGSPVDKKKAPGLTDAEVEEPLSPLLDYLDQSLETFRKYLSESAWQVVMTKIWKEVIGVIEGLLVPALSDQPTEMKPLTDKEVDIVFQWLKFLTDFFHAEGSGVPIEELRNPRYRSVMLIRLYYDWSTDQLMEESVRLTNQQLMASSNANGVARSKSVYQQRNLGTIKQRKQQKQEESDSGAAEMVMRILRLRPDAIDFIQQQMGTLNLVQEKQRKPTRLLGSIRGRGRGKSRALLGGPSNSRHRTNQSFSQMPSVPATQWKQYR